ncbi:MAG: TrkH family potassium uptake protein, partial [Candidatus Aminicenantes bacterium]|nr:TrkH family potassium uptake protein [Candidatus Aminicenantes bacterium]
MKKSASFIIIITFLSVIIVGVFLLRLPVSTVGGSIKLEDAFFTATSAVAVTGLIVVDTATYFTFFGQLVILLLIQFGGLGLMAFSTLFILLMGKSISLQDLYIIENVFTAGGHKNLKELLKKIFILTFTIEFIGAVVLFFHFSHIEMGKRIFAAVFHSISAFCNAGFSIFSNNLESYTADVGINITIMLLIILGGIGFLVIDEILLLFKRKIKSFSRCSVHTKIVVTATAVLIFLGAALILIQELLNKNNNLPFGAKLLSSIFHSVAARTAGFNTVNLNIFSSASIFFLIILMFSGASPGSTGGGIKTSTLGIIFAFFRSKLKGREKIDLFYREISRTLLEQAFTVILLATFLISLSFILLLSFESNFKMSDLLFDIVSAFGTVGLSLGITPLLSAPSKIVLALTMFIG